MQREQQGEPKHTFPSIQATKDKVSVNQKTKKKRQQRAQSRLAMARFRQHQRQHRQQTAAQLADLGATVLQQEVQVDGRERTIYEVTCEGNNYRFGTRFRLQRWLKRERQHRQEEQMSWAERHVQWMIENNCDDFGNPWPQ